MRKIFGISHFKEEEADAVVVGLEYTKDSRETLEQFRLWSSFVEPFDILEGKNLLENLKIFDIGNINLEKIDEFLNKMLEHKKVPIILSRGHFPTYLILKNFSNVKLLVLDAHADCKNEYIDELIYFDSIFTETKRAKYNGATWLRRLLEEKNLEVCLIGVRSLDEDELEFLKSKKLKYFSPTEIKEGKKLKQIEEFTENSRIYISLDADVFDPSIFNSTDYPEPEGINLTDFRNMLNVINGEVIGIDVCCFNLEGNVKSSYMLISKALMLLLSKIKKF